MEKELFETRNRCISRYNNLREKFLTTASLHVKNIELNELKIFYNNVINSKRESERIKDLGGLLKILERRAVLDWKSIEPIKQIADEIVKDRQLNQEIQYYQNNLKSDEAALALLSPIGFNLFKCQQTATAAAAGEEQFIPFSSTLVPSTIYQNTDFQTKVFQRVGDNLGRHWRDVARFLNLKEAEIDAIEEKTNLKLEEKSFEIFKIFKSRCETCYWQQKLIRALTKARRKDLVELVEELISENSRQ